MSLRTDTISGVKWSSVSQFGKQGLAFIVTAILPRLLNPSDYAGDNLIVDNLMIFIRNYFAE